MIKTIFWLLWSINQKVLSLLKFQCHDFWVPWTICFRCIYYFAHANFNPLNPACWFSSLRKRGAKNPTGCFSGICCGVSKTRRASKSVHVRSIMNWFVYTGRYQATLRSQVESSSLFTFCTTCNLLMGFVLNAQFCVENMAEIFSVCEDADTRLML